MLDSGKVWLIKLQLSVMGIFSLSSPALYNLISHRGKVEPV